MILVYACKGTVFLQELSNSYTKFATELARSIISVAKCIMECLSPSTFCCKDMAKIL